MLYYMYSYLFFIEPTGKVLEIVTIPLAEVQVHVHKVFNGL